MSTTSCPTAITSNALASFVGAPCTVTRVGRPYRGQGTLLLRDLEGHWLQPPLRGWPLWFLVGAADEVRSVRTSPVVSVELDETEHTVSVRTQGARYHFVFNSGT